MYQVQQAARCFACARGAVQHAVFCAGAAVLLAAPTLASAEQKSYVIDRFSQAAYSQDGDCPDGLVPRSREIYPKYLASLGYTPPQIRNMMAEYSAITQEGSRVEKILGMRARVNGQLVNAYAHPAAIPDPKLSTVVGKFAFGFNLDGKSGAASFEDPVTHEKGVDNELFRAMGCIEQFRGSATTDATYWAFIWTTIRATMSSWLFTISGENLGKDGPITITFDRAIESVQFATDGRALPDASYRIDPDPRSHHAFRGEIRNGEIVVTEAGFLRLLQDPLAAPEFVLHDVHLRLTRRADGGLDGLLGGYQPWKQFYFQIAHAGVDWERDSVGVDLPGVYHALRRLADGRPDPQSGESTAISAAYRFEAVPVFAIPSSGKTPQVQRR